MIPPKPTCPADRPCGSCAGCTDDTLHRAAWATESVLVPSSGVADLNRAADAVDVMDAARRTLGVGAGMTPAERERLRIEVALAYNVDPVLVLGPGIRRLRPACGKPATIDAVVTGARKPCRRPFGHRGACRHHPLDPPKPLKPVLVDSSAIL